jgi:hypothetical protein
VCFDVTAELAMLVTRLPPWPSAESTCCHLEPHAADFLDGKVCVLRANSPAKMVEAVGRRAADHRWLMTG